MGGAGCEKGFQEVGWLSHPYWGRACQSGAGMAREKGHEGIGCWAALNQGRAGLGEGPRKLGQLAPPPDQSIALAAVGLIETGCFGSYGVLVAVFLYI